MEKILLCVALGSALLTIFGVPLAFFYGINTGMKAASFGSRSLFGVVPGSSGFAGDGVPFGQPAGGSVPGKNASFSADEDEFPVDAQVEKFIAQFNGKPTRLGGAAVGSLVDPELAGRAPVFAGGGGEHE